MTWKCSTLKCCVESPQNSYQRSHMDRKHYIEYHCWFLKPLFYCLPYCLINRKIILMTISHRRFLDICLWLWLWMMFGGLICRWRRSPSNPLWCMIPSDFHHCMYQNLILSFLCILVYLASYLTSYLEESSVNTVRAGVWQKFPLNSPEVRFVSGRC